MQEDVWREIENSCPENRKLGKVLRLVEGIYGGCSSVDWTQPRLRCAEVLEKFFKEDPDSQRLTELAAGKDYEVGGDEHHLIRIDDPDRVYKVTHGDAFGCYSRFSKHDIDPPGKHFHGSVNDDPAFYLKRWMILNWITGYRTRLEGVIPPAKSDPLPEKPLILHRFCISQPTIVVKQSPPERLIRKSLEEYGFQNISQDAFLNFESEVLLTDAAPRNVRIVEGVPVLFDAIATFASPDVLNWVRT